MINIIGYFGLIFNLLSMTMKNIIHLRLLALCGNLIYIIYGFLLNSMPFLIGCTIMGHRTKRFFQWSGKMGERF